MGAPPQPRTKGDEPAAAGAPARRKLLILALALVLFYAVSRTTGAYVPRFSAWVEHLGVWGPAVFIVGYAVAAVAFVPASLLTLAAGAIFGIIEGTVYVMIGATFGACAAFLVARHVARDVVARRLGEHARFGAVDRAVAREGLKIVFLLRLSPVFPYNLLNYTLGITNVAFRDYAIACTGMLPGTLLYVYYGKVAGDVAAVAAGTAPARDAAGNAVLALGLLATIAATAIVTRAARSALRGSSIEP